MLVDVPPVFLTSSRGRRRKDPFALSTYLNKSIYLADVNNERPDRNPQHKANLLSLANFVMVYSTIDDVIVPRESGWFEFYAPDKHDSVVPLRQTDYYQQDWLGLRTLDESKRLQMYACQCMHQNYPDDQCRDVFTKFTLPYLNVTMADVGL